LSTKGKVRNKGRNFETSVQFADEVCAFCADTSKYFHIKFCEVHIFFLPTAACISLNHSPNTVFVLDETVPFLAVPCFRRVNVVWSPRTSGFDHRAVFVGYVFDGVAIRTGFLRVYIICFSVRVIPSLLCIPSFSPFIRSSMHHRCCIMQAFDSDVNP